MRFPYEQIWAVDAFFKESFERYDMTLCLGDYSFSGIGVDTLDQLKEPLRFSDVLFSELFIERDLFWQPNLVPSLSAWQSRFGTTKLFLKECIDELNKEDASLAYLYAGILHNMAVRIDSLAEVFCQSPLPSKKELMAALMQFRLGIHPHLRFFLAHPHFSVSLKYNAQRLLSLMVRHLILEGRYDVGQFEWPMWQFLLPEKKKEPAEEKKGRPSKQQPKGPSK